MAAEGYDAVSEKIRKQLLLTRTRLTELFKDFDAHNTKRVTRPQFARAINKMGMVLSPAELDAIQAMFTNGDEYIRYQEFADDMDKVFNTKGLESNPLADTSSRALAGQRLHAFGQQLDADEQLMWDALQEKLTYIVKTRGLIVKAFFLDHDRLHTGYVTPAQFRRAMSSCFGVGCLNGMDLQLIEKKYSDGKDVNYRQLHEDITDDSEFKIDPGMSATQARRVAALDAGADDVNVQDVLDRIIRQTAVNRIRVGDVFRDFDPMRTGCCTMPQFKRGLILCNFKGITEAESTALSRNFWNSARNQVCYADFVDEVDQAFTQKGLENAPTRTLDSHARDVALAAKRPAPTLSDDQAALYTEAINTIRSEIKRRGINIVPLFQDFDRIHSEYVSEAQFLRALKMVDCMPVDTRKVKALCARYGRSGSQKGLIDYRAFLEDIEPQRTLARAGAQVANLTKPGVPYSAATDVVAVLKKVKLICKKGSIRIEEFLRDFDKLRHGYLTRQQFSSALSTAAVALSPPEVEALVEAFRDDRTVDSAGQPMVAWRDFADDVDSVFTLKHLEQNPTIDVGGAQSELLNSSLVLSGAAGAGAGAGVASTRRLSGSSEAHLRRMLTRVEGLVQQRRMNLSSFFQDFDKLHRGVMTAPQFLRCLDRAGVQVDSADMEVIAQAFCTPGDKNEVNYKWFMEALDSIDGVLDNLPGAEDSLAVSGAFASAGGVAAPAAAPKVRHMPRSDVDINELLHRIQVYFTANRIRLKEFLADYDPLRRGYITASKLRTGLSAAGMYLKPEELDCLEASYRHDTVPDAVLYHDLAYAVDGGNECLEQHPTADVHATFVRDPTARKTIEATDSKSSAVVEALAKGRDFIAQRNVLLKPMFQSYDRLRHNTVTKAQFLSVVRLAGFGYSNATAALVAEYFESSTEKGMINYLDFVRAVDDSEL